MGDYFGGRGGRRRAVCLSGAFSGLWRRKHILPGRRIAWPCSISALHSHVVQGWKVKECKTCHDAIFATQKYGTYVLRALKDSPPKKIHIGRDASTLYVPGSAPDDEVSLAGYEVPRACATCATGNCHDGKESFSRLECLGCHQAK